MAIGNQTMTNSDFLAEVYGNLTPGEYGWVCSFRADPSSQDPGKWAGRAYKGLPNQAATIDRATQDNTYFCTAVLQATEDGEVVRRKDAFKRLAVLVLDDVQLSDVQGYSYALQTSPGKFQIGIFIDGEDTDSHDLGLINRVMSALAARGRSNDASGNACVRYVRLPVGVNTKPRAAGDWPVQLESWNPNVRWSLEDACAAVGIDLDALRGVEPVKPSSSSTGAGNHAGEMITGLVDPNLSARAYHDSITRLAASLIAGGMFPGAAVDHLYSLMDAAKPDIRQADEYRRWEARRAEIPRAVKSAEKFAPPERKAPSITVNLHAGSQDEPEHEPGDVQPLDWKALQGVEPEPISWAIQGWLPHRHVTLLAANGGVGKSNLSLQMAVSLAMGQQFMGLDTQQGKVLVISGEDDKTLVHLRVRNICKDAGVSMGDLVDRIVVYDMTQHDCVLWRDGLPTERMQWLAEEVMHHKPDVVILDNASDLYADNENDRTAVRGFLRCLKTIAGASHAAILLLAHVDKASVRSGAGQDTDSTFSGSTAWNNSARSRWAMVTGQDKNEVIIKHEKCNVGPKQEPFSVEFDPAAHVFRRFGTIPGSALAKTVVRNAQRAAILKLIGREAGHGTNLSMKANAPTNNIYNVLADDPEFPGGLDRKTFFGILRDLENEQLIAQEPYKKANRTTGYRVVLTQSGETRVAMGSGAGPTWAQREDEDES